MATPVQINRDYELVIGDTGSEDALVIRPPMALTFNVTKSSTNVHKHDSGEIEITNLPDDALKVLSGDYPAAILKVGYVGQQLITILSGEIISASTRKQGTDKITQILIGSGYVALNHENIEAVVPEGQTVKQVIELLQKEIPGVNKGVFSGFNINSVCLYGYPMSGTARQILENLCNTYNLSYNIDNNVLNVFDKNGSIDENYQLAPLIDETSGLVDIPYETRVDVGKAKKSLDNKGGVHFKCLLNPTLIAGSIVKIESKPINGWFIISDLRHYGGNRENDWYTDCKCVDKKNPKAEEL
jgi:hypothetical protein